MKKITLFVIVIGLMAITSVLVAGDKDYPQFKFGGRITMELITENNMDDFTDFDSKYSTADTSYVTKGNDTANYGRARVDLNFTTKITEDISAVIKTRFESDAMDEDEKKDTDDNGWVTDGNKWMTFGSNQEDDNIEDSSPRLQEAYIGFKKIFVDGLNGEIGRKVYKYGTGNVMSDKDKVDGWRIGYNFDNGEVNMHYIIREQHENLEHVDESCQQWLYGLNGGMDSVADMVDFNVYYWIQYSTDVTAEADTDPKKADESAVDMINILGVRGDFTLMEGMITPYIEAAIQTGAEEKGYQNDNGGYEDKTYSGYLLDLGTDFEKEVSEMVIDANLEIMILSGDDKKTGEENEGWQGIGLGNREMGYMDYNVTLPLFKGTKADGSSSKNYTGLTMFNIGAGVTMIKDLRFGFDYFMFQDNSSNFYATKDTADDTKISGETMWSEFDLNLDYQMAKKTCLYATFGYVMPNSKYPYKMKDGNYSFGEDAAMGFVVGAETKW